MADSSLDPLKPPPTEHHLRDGSGASFYPKLALYKPEFIRALTPAQARGIVWIFSQPDPRTQYVLACDPSFGIPGWHPELATDEDLETDNAAISVWAVRKTYLEQVAEYAAPIQPHESAWVANALGRLFCGSDPLNMAQAIVESFPGPGPVFEQVFLGQHYYINYWTPKPLETFEGLGTGLSWRADLQNNKTISLNARKVVQAKKVLVRSPWLAHEMQDAELDKEKWKIEVPEGGKLHDDRLRAAMLAWYLVYGKEVNLAPPQPEQVAPPQKGPKVDWQSTDCTEKEMQRLWEQRLYEIANQKI